MIFKKTVIYGILVWFLIYIFSTICSPYFDDSIPYINMITPIIIIIITTFFGIIYIRNFDSHEALEGFKVGIIFLIIDIICDLIFFVIPGQSNIIVENYTFHLLSMIVLTPLITTFLGYLAQMPIDLK